MARTYLLLFFFFRRILHSKGELSEDRHKQYEEFATSYQKLLANTQSLADLLDENMPELPQDKSAQEGAYKRLPLGVRSSVPSLFFFSCVYALILSSVSSASSLRLPDHGPGIDIFTPGKPGEYDLEGGIWEDEDARNFYENLVDLKAFVPAILFKDNEKSGQAKDRDDASAAGVKGASPKRSLACYYYGLLLLDPSLSVHCRRQGGQGRHHRGAGAGAGGPGHRRRTPGAGRR